jgi:hypothetical protein
MAPPLTREALDTELFTDKVTVVEAKQEWDNLEDAKWDVRKSIIDRGESWGYQKSDQRRLILRCKDANCTFKVQLSLLKSGKARLATYDPHICRPTTHDNFQAAKSAKYLAEHHQRSIALNRKIKPRQIIENEIAHYSRPRISAKQAIRTRKYVTKKLDGLEHNTFTLLPDYLKKLKKVDLDTYTDIKLHPDTNAFQALFIALGPMRKGFHNLREFWGVDGTHTRSQYRMILCVTIAIDANSEILPICWGVIPGENEVWWKWYLGNQGRAFPAMKTVAYQGVAISDREKGLDNAIAHVFPRIEHSSCCQHIAENIQARYGKDARALFVPIAKSRDPEQYYANLNKLQEHNNNAYEYVKAIPPKSYCFAFFPRPRFNHDTNNITECVNGLWTNLRDMPLLQMLDEIHTDQMKRIFKRKTTRPANLYLSNVAYTKYKARSKTAGNFEVTPSGNGVFQVEDKARKLRRIVDLTNRTCTCKWFQEMKGPCACALAAVHYNASDPLALFHQGYTQDAYRQMYENHIRPYLLDKLQPDNTIQPAKISRGRGRPKSRRIRKGQHHKPLRICGTCKQRARHNAATCDRQPVAEAEIESSSNSSNRDQDSLDSDSDSNLEDLPEWIAEIEEDSQFDELTSPQKKSLALRRRKRACEDAKSSALENRVCSLGNSVRIRAASIASSDSSELPEDPNETSFEGFASDTPSSPQVDFWSYNDLLDVINQQPTRSKSPSPDPIIAIRRKEREQKESEERIAAENLRKALEDVETPESAFWRYKRVRRLWRLENGFATDSVYRDEVGLSSNLDIHGKLVKEPAERAIASTAASNIGICKSRVRDHLNFQVLNGETMRQSSPWTVPEIRAYHDFNRIAEEWLVENEGIQVAVQTSNRRGRRQQEAEDNARSNLWVEQLRDDFHKMKVQHAANMKNNKAYAALYKAEEQEDERDIKRAIQLRLQREGGLPIILNTSDLFVNDIVEDDADIEDNQPEIEPLSTPNAKRRRLNTTNQEPPGRRYFTRQSKK